MAATSRRTHSWAALSLTAARCGLRTLLACFLAWVSCTCAALLLCIPASNHAMRKSHACTCDTGPAGLCAADQRQLWGIRPLCHQLLGQTDAAAWRRPGIPVLSQRQHARQGADQAQPGGLWGCVQESLFRNCQSFISCWNVCNAGVQVQVYVPESTHHCEYLL